MQISDNVQVELFRFWSCPCCHKGLVRSSKATQPKYCTCERCGARSLFVKWQEIPRDEAVAILEERIMLTKIRSVEKVKR